VEDKSPGHDLLALLEEGWSVELPEEGPQVLILHSHSTEAYTPEGEDGYEASDPGRTLDKEKNVIRVGDELAAVLEEAGFTVLHDRELYDWPSYNGAYARSRAAAEDWLEEYPGIRVVIDLHRDALGGAKTLCPLPEGGSCAQVMLVLTTGDSGLYHPNWRENVKLGLELQRELETAQPGLSRPLLLSPARYNEQLSPGYFLLEVGSDANTLREALEAVRRFGACAAAVFARHLTNGRE
jgi:stage II sporulation protein P